jgi:hypothetical protein
VAAGGHARQKVAVKAVHQFLHLAELLVGHRAGDGAGICEAPGLHRVKGHAMVVGQLLQI